jgi:hypothetical protein
MQANGGGQEADLQHSPKASSIQLITHARMSQPPAARSFRRQADQPLPERRRQLQVTVFKDYGQFQARVKKWLARQVMSRTGDIHRERSLVDSSNLPKLHKDLLYMDYAGQQVTLEARLIPREFRYERVDFRTPGVMLAEPLEFESQAPQIREQIRKLRARREIGMPLLLYRVREASRLGLHAALSGSRRYRKDTAIERFRDIDWLATFVSRSIGGPEEPGERFAERHIKAQELREMESMADTAYAVAERSLAQINRIDEQLRDLYRRIGKEYVPDKVAPDMPDVKL